MEPLTPASTLPVWTPPSEWTSAQRNKITELSNKCIARARRPYVRYITLAKTALELGRLQLAASNKLTALLT